MRVHFVIHESFESAGAYLKWAEDRGYTISWSRVYAGEALPPNADEFDMLVVFGGPQSPRTTREECPYFDSQAEQHLINQAISARKIVVGICLGSQLIGEALGAKVCQSPEKEIGHWHNDMPGLTDQAIILATSEGCPRQIVQYGNFVYGFQCHMEFTVEAVEGLIQHSQQELADAQRKRFIRSVAEMRAWNYQQMNEKLWRFLDELTLAHSQK
ncbi:type 1 glutamine amidotransferase [Salmonella enterica subsp. enterica serovar Paratyphi A]|uniref:Glutamine amidotransferase n=8 Tax=Bacteria TaxID=2 RepID=A0A5H6Q618_SALPT|nr:MULTISPECIES: type 1 glutamine amidotransferase [Salmonella]EBA0150485.1 glutamine amidotransferase [Salmonella enterica subsp. enterica serovar Enteritidis]EBX8731696.1 glutamine amidotransferase [Salmonella enterica subsp. enterica serovar Sendai]ECD7318095.1 glutamine amidotransferase [Salmonella enterica subsp. enterica serovar Typhi]EDT3615594.1 type 1 glutamine amidotransferase [Salmonella enterica subsp. enterica serovar Java]EGI6563874.1 type 1 glutamine amidotransferase [Salmonella